MRDARYQSSYKPAASKPNAVPQYSMEEEKIEMPTNHLRRTVVVLLILLPVTLIAQVHDVAPLTNWAAPLYWQPNHTEKPFAAKPDAVSNQVEATNPANALVFVGMTPCRVVDTRNPAFPAGFGPPSLIGGTKRTFDIRSDKSHW